MNPARLTFRLRVVPEAVFVDLLREAGVPLDARGLRERLELLGVARGAAVAAWRAAQPKIRRHGQVVREGTRYRWSEQPVPRPADDV